MSKRPVLLLAAMFCVGILSGEVKAAIVLAGFLLIYAKPWKEKGIRKAVFAAGLPLLFFLGMFCMCRESTFRQNYLDRMQDEQRVRLAGRVTRIEEKARCFYYYLTDCTISLSGQHMQTNDVIAYVSSDEYSIGQILTIEGTISLFDVATNEGAFDARQFYRSQKIDFGIWVERVIAVCGKPDRYRMFLENIRQRLKNNIESSMKDGGVLSAMILGEKSGLDAEVKSLYQKAGISHILAISGLHVSFLGMGLTLYFSSKDGTKLVPETREVHYSSNISLEKLVMEQLMEGPKTKKKLATIPTGTKLITITVVDGVCYVNMDETFQNQNQEISEQVVLYSIVDSLTELSSVDKVQISINGDTSGKCRYTYDLSPMYKEDLSIVENGQEEVDSTQ